MKKTVSILLMLLTMTFGAIAQESFAKQFKGKDGFSCVTIGKAAMKMMPRQSKQNLKIGALADKIDKLEIVSASNEKASAQLTKTCNKWIEKDGFESLLDIDSEGDQASIYMKNNGDNNIYLLLANDKGFASVIIIYGTMTLDEIQSITNKN